jgi:DNA end-binding protein Ku
VGVAKTQTKKKAKTKTTRSKSAAPKKRANKQPTTTKRAIWKGSITFGLISIPVGLFTAIEERDVSFHMLSGKDGSRIRFKRVSEKSGREVDYGDIVRGYEYEKGKYVTFTDDELDRIPSDSVRAIDVVSFVDKEDVDPVYFQQPYFLAPEEAGLKAYQLFLNALEKSNKVGVGKVTIREKERLCTIRVKDEVLVLETMHWPDEIRAPSFDVLEKRTNVRPQEVKMAESLIRNLSDDFRPEEFEDTYRQRLEEFIEAKIEGEEITLAPEEKEIEEVPDLMEALRASVEASKSGRQRNKKSA